MDIIEGIEIEERAGLIRTMLSCLTEHQLRAVLSDALESPLGIYLAHSLVRTIGDEGGPAAREAAGNYIAAVA